MGNHEVRLAQRIAQGERGAYEEFIDRYGARVHNLVRRTVPNTADAEDVTQEIFLDLYRSLSSFRGDSTLATWVYRVALNHCLRHRERQGPPLDSLESIEHEPADLSPDPARYAVRGELAGQVREALDELSHLHRDVIILHELHGLTYRECADVLGVPVGTVKSRLANAFRCLRASLGSYVLGDAAPRLPEALGETS